MQITNKLNNLILWIFGVSIILLAITLKNVKSDISEIKKTHVFVDFNNVSNEILVTNNNAEGYAFFILEEQFKRLKNEPK